MQDTDSILNIQEMTHTFLVKNCLIFYSTCICNDIISENASTVDSL